VQSAAAAGPDRTSILVQIMPALGQVLPSIKAMLPSTGGPSLVVLGLGVVVFGSLGLWLRRAGASNRPD
jgi:hypothetical protein